MQALARELEVGPRALRGHFTPPVPTVPVRASRCVAVPVPGRRYQRARVSRLLAEGARSAPDRALHRRRGDVQRARGVP